MMVSQEIRDFVLPTAPAKTLWFEFLFIDGLVESHLSEGNADPSGPELIIQFLNNVNAISPLVPTGPVVIPTHTTNGSGDVNNRNDNNGNGNGNSNGTASVNGSENGERSAVIEKKMSDLKLLAVKVFAFFNFDLDFLEKLPLAMQYTLVNTLRKYTSSVPSSTLKLFGEVLYFRWVLRCLSAASLPTRLTRGIQVPLPVLQQNDPSFTPFEVTESVMKILYRELDSVLASAEGLLTQRTLFNARKIAVPSVKCFSIKKPYFDWNLCESIEGRLLENNLRYEMGKFYFVRDPPNFPRAYSLFNSIPPSDRIDYDDIVDYISASHGMISDSPPGEDTTPADKLRECLDVIFNATPRNQSSSELFVSLLDLSIVSLDAETVSEVLAPYQLGPSTIYQSVLQFLTSRVQGLKELLPQEMKIDEDTVAETPSMASVTDGGREEGEADDSPMEVTEDINSLSLDDIEKQFIDSASPDVILDLSRRLVLKIYREINPSWTIPFILENELSSLPHEKMRNQSLLILAKANQLRSDGHFSEARELYRFILESNQTFLPQLGELIPYEIDRTDLETILKTGDTNENLLQKFALMLNPVHFDYRLLEFGGDDYIQLICCFLLDHDPISGHLMREGFSSHFHPLVRLSSILYLSSSGSFPQNGKQYSKDLWESVMACMVGNTSRTRTANQPFTVSPQSLESFVKKIRSPQAKYLVIACLIKLYNLVRDNSVNELTIPILPHAVHWPASLGLSPPAQERFTPSLQTIGSVLKELVKQASDEDPQDLTWIRCRAELALVESEFEECIRHYLVMLSLMTDYFTVFSRSRDEDYVIQRLITASNKLSCHTQSAVLQQMANEPNYSLAFKSLSERSCFDSCDDLIECIWDVSLLEYLVNLHTRRGDLDRKSRAVSLIGQLELNSNNPPEILREAANVRKTRFFRILAKRYL